MTPPELRITDAEVAACPRESVVCPSCHGLGVYEGRGVVDDVPCSRCNGGGEVRGDRIVLDGASARIGAAIVGHIDSIGWSGPRWVRRSGWISKQGGWK